MPGEALWVDYFFNVQNMDMRFVLGKKSIFSRISLKQEPVTCDE
jgi:hypothetical protein